MRKIITFLLSLVAVSTYGQYSDSFADGDFSNNPVWSGTTDKFIVNGSGQLQLQASAVTSTAWLSTPSVAINNASWQFYLKTGLLLTSANYVNYYLVSNNADLSGALNGYYVMVGNTNKEVALYRQSGSIKTKLVAGAIQRLPTSGSTTEIIVKVTRDAAGNWALFSKLPSDSDFVQEGTTNDATFYQSAYSGIFCNYSSTNSTKYYFDDFLVTGYPFVDIVPPTIVSYGLSGNNSLVVNFSEAISLSGATITVPATLEPYTQSLSGTTLTLNFAQPIPNYQNFVITLEDIADLFGNILSKSDLTFGLFPTGFGDLVFNEIMCDPSPVVGLPEVEYIELYNRRDFPIDLTGWKFYYNTKAYSISAGNIKANGYLLLCSSSASVALSGFGNVASMSSFPALSSTGQLLYLVNDKDSLIAFVSYSNRWYNDDFKKAGGWSLECIDSENLSGTAANWTASSDLSGGTPGRKNSMAATLEDELQPRIKAVSLSLPDTLLVQFNKSMLFSELNTIAKYNIDGNLLIKSVLPDYPQGKWAKLIFSPAPQQRIMYRLSINELKDVNGYPLTESIAFGVSDNCEYNDLIINEILSHPQTNGTTFVELYNRSQKIIDLKNLWLNRIKTTGVLDAGFAITILGNQLLPGEYVVLTPSKDGICNFYDCHDDSKWIEMSSFVSLPNTSGNVMLVNRQGLVIDSVSYAEKQHDATITNPIGVSFERVNPDWASSNSANWHSCASDAGYATPGYRNSQFRQNSETTSGYRSFWLDNQTFTPDNDGVDDMLLIRYKMPDNGYSATVAVYDAAGRCVKRIADNAVLGAAGTLVWNGTTDSGRLANIGVYVIYIDAVLSAEGKREKTKLACVLMAK